MRRGAGHRVATRRDAAAKKLKGFLAELGYV